MVKRVVEQFECDRCGKDASRYSIVYPEATLILDRCQLHAKKLEALRNETGEWVSNTSGRQAFKKSSLADLRLAVAAGNHDGNGEGPK